MKTLNLTGAIALCLFALSCSKKESLVAPTPASSLNSQKHTEWSLGDPLVNGVYWFKNPAGQCFQNGTFANPTEVTENSYIGYPNQQWEVTNLGGYGFLKIVNHSSGLALSVPDSSKAQNVTLVLEPYTGAANQIWLVQYLAYGQYEIWNANSGLALTVSSGSGSQLPVVQSTFNNVSSQQWEPTLLSSLGTNTTYYVSSSKGNDSNTGLDSLHAWKTLTHASVHTYVAGNWLLLRSGDTWTGQVLALKGSGTSLNPILLSSYGQSARPMIQPKITDTACVYMKGISGWQISNLDLSDARDGICADYDQVYNSDYLYIENCNLHDFTNTYNSNPNFYNHWSNGVLLEGYAPLSAGRQVALSDFTMHDCSFTNCNVGFNGMCTPAYYCNGSGFTNGALVQLQNFTITNCTSANSGQFAINITSGNNGTVTNFSSNGNGTVANQYGSCTAVVTYSEYVTFNGYSATKNYRGPQAKDGEGFDFESGMAPDGKNQHDITLENSSIVTSDGSAILINAGTPSQNCTINNVTITNYGQNVGNLGSGIYIAPGSSGTISNTTFNRNNTEPYYNYNYPTQPIPDYTLTNNVYH